LLFSISGFKAKTTLNQPKVACRKQAIQQLQKAQTYKHSPYENKAFLPAILLIVFVKKTIKSSKLLRLKALRGCKQQRNCSLQVKCSNVDLDMSPTKENMA